MVVIGKVEFAHQQHFHIFLFLQGSQAISMVIKMAGTTQIFLLIQAKVKTGWLFFSPVHGTFHLLK